uniref:Uncharacterized protein n=1 Tax=Arundo donax TaxID=35708 RepID=A0A0A8YSI9_ARUDO
MAIHSYAILVRICLLEWGDRIGLGSYLALVRRHLGQTIARQLLIIQPALSV